MSFPNPPLAAPTRFAQWVILIAVLLDMAGFGVSLTVLPPLIGKLAGAAQAGWINGVFVGVWALVQFFTAPVLGLLSDRFGRRPMLLVSMAGPRMKPRPNTAPNRPKAAVRVSSVVRSAT